MTRPHKCQHSRLPPCSLCEGDDIRTMAAAKEPTLKFDTIEGKPVCISKSCPAFIGTMPSGPSICRLWKGDAKKGVPCMPGYQQLLDDARKEICQMWEHGSRHDVPRDPVAYAERRGWGYLFEEKKG